MITPYQLVKYHLYLLQLENYELRRFWNLLLKRGWLPNRKTQRKDLVWTMKAQALFTFAVILHFSLIFWFIWTTGSYWMGLLEFIFLMLFYPLFFGVGVLLMWPFDFIAKNFLVLSARFKIKKLSNLKIIGIAGSYGKTTMKEVLKQVLSSKYKVVSTPESVNTPVGIARWILNSVDETAQVIIVEMGEHYRGDVQQLCKITPPDFAVVTGINQAHLERMGDMGNLVATIFEIVASSKPETKIILNGDDTNVVANYKKFAWPDQEVQEYKVESGKYKVFDTAKLVWNFEIDELGKVDVNLLGEYVLGFIDAAVKIGKVLGLTTEEIKRGISKIKPVEHRLQPIKSQGNVLVIDDSYNGNPDGAREAINVLSKFENRRRVYITPGLVEMGESASEVHREIGRQLAPVANVVILIKNSVTPFIEEGIKLGNKHLTKPAGQIVWFNTTQEAHASFGKILQPYDVILFQNDWGDQYI